MIRPLRKRHRVMISALSVVLPLVFFGGIAARTPVPVSRSVPAGFEDQASDFATVVWTKEDLWPDRRIITALLGDAAGSKALKLMFREVVKPDVLVYWAAGIETAGERLPDNARLLGALSNRTPLALPADARGKAGRFVLYSVADHEIVARSNPVKL